MKVYHCPDLWRVTLCPERLYATTSTSTDQVSTSEQQNYVREYYRLLKSEHLSEEDEELLGFILEKAQEDEILDSWITDINQVVSQELNLMSEEECKNQKALLQEHLVTNDLPAILKIKPLSFLYLLRWSLSRYQNNWLAKVRAFFRAIKIQVFWKKLNSIDFGPIAYKLVSNGWTQQRTKKAIATYIAFMLLVYLYPNSRIVPTKEIDAVWHNHTLDASKYSQDCQHLFGHFLHHFPYFGVRGETDRQNLDMAFARTKTLFQEHFGEDILAENYSPKANCKPFDIEIEDVLETFTL